MRLFIHRMRYIFPEYFYNPLRIGIFVKHLGLRIVTGLNSFRCNKALPNQVGLIFKTQIAMKKVTYPLIKKYGSPLSQIYLSIMDNRKRIRIYTKKRVDRENWDVIAGRAYFDGELNLFLDFLSIKTNEIYSDMKKSKNFTEHDFRRKVEQEIEEFNHNAGIDYIGNKGIKFNKPDYKCLYLIQCELGRLKIGVANDVDQRKNSLELASGLKMETLFIIPNGEPLEKVLHKKFDNYRTIGEWFRFNQEIVNEYIKLTSKLTA
jgi:hypothetical protein